MRVTVLVGSEKLRVPIDDPSRTMAWLQSEIIRRWERSHKGEYLHIHELRTSDNVRLDNEDQCFGVMQDNEQIVVILGTGTEKEVGPGDMIHQYYLAKLIGEGTYGRVYRAHDLNLNRHVAVKVLRREKANEVNTRRFLREAELNGSLSSSPYICSVYDFGRTRGGTLFLVMELLQGRPMNELLDERISARQPFTVLECIHLLSPVLRGLHDAHRHNPSIVHRDLKPDNIWIRSSFSSSSSPSASPHAPSVSKVPTGSTGVSSSRRPDDNATLIMDFGIAIHDEITHETLACGTRMYSSPEQTRKKVKIDGRSDLWSVGVILYQMLSLLVDVPFDPVEIVVNKSVVPPLSLHTQTPLSPEFHAAVMKALEVDPANRWQTAEEFGDALHQEEMRIREGSKKPTRDSATEATAQAATFSGSAAADTTTTPAADAASTSTPSSSSASTAAVSAPAPAPAASSDSHLHPRLQRARRGMAFSTGPAPGEHMQAIQSKL